MISAKIIKSIFELDDNNRLIWKERGREQFTPKSSGKDVMDFFNRTTAGKSVKADYGKQGTKISFPVQDCRIEMPLEQIIYLLTKGDYDGQIVFADLDPSNYDPSNLKAVSFNTAELFWTKAKMPVRRMDQPLSVDDLRSLIRYDEWSGTLYWKPRSAEWYDGDQKKADEFNANIKSKEIAGLTTRAFKADARHGGFKGQVMKRHFTAEEMVWVLHHGKRPDDGYILVHKDGNPKNNKIDNLEPIPFASAPSDYQMLQIEIEEAEMKRKNNV